MRLAVLAAVLILTIIFTVSCASVAAAALLSNPAPSRQVNSHTFPIGSRQVVDYAYSLRVRTGPSVDYDVLAYVHRGDVVEVLDYSGRFVQICTPRGKGWIYSGFLSREYVAEDEDSAEVYRPSPPKSVTEIPDLNINLWTYHLRFFDSTAHDGTMHDLTDEYEALYGIVYHEAQGAVFALRTDTAIPNFDFIEVGLGGGDTGMLYFYPGDVLHSFDMFTPENALVVTTHFGTMPRIAVTFLDENGTRRYLTIQQCGIDGSVLLIEFPLDVKDPF